MKLLKLQNKTTGKTIGITRKVAPKTTNPRRTASATKKTK